MFNFRLDSEELYFSIDLGWPKWIPWFNNTAAWYKHWPVSQNKSAEVQIECDWNCLFEFTVSLTRNTDHAGAQLSIGFLKHWASISVVDNRHWNYDANQYYNDGDYDNMYFTSEEAESKVAAIAQTIKSGIKDEELDKILKELPSKFWTIAVVGKLAEWQYSTEANRVASKIWNKELESAWWVSKPPGTPQSKSNE